MSSPSIEGDGLLNAAFHWLSDWSPFIILPSNPFVDDVMRLEEEWIWRQNRFISINITMVRGAALPHNSPFPVSYTGLGNEKKTYKSTIQALRHIKLSS